ncbi:MAG: CBS domain-containing protein [Planctomycetota bacterium]|jgi:CBS domain-containing protein
MNVERLMSSDVVSCRPDDSMAQAARAMWDRDCGVVPVVDSDRVLVGIVTDRDICIAALTKGRTLDEMAVGAVMRRKVYSCRADQSLRAVHALLREFQVRRLPVVDEQSRLVGVVSINDLALAAAETEDASRTERLCEVAETMAAICQHREPSLTD